MTDKTSLSNDSKFGESARMQTARRRLIRGSFAVPVALTVCSGSAVAATSLSCVARKVSNNALDPGNTPGVTYMQAQVYFLGTPAKYYLKGSDLSGLDSLSTRTPKSNAVFSSSSFYQIAYDPAATSPQSTGNVPTVAATLSGSIPGPLTNKSVVLRFDAAGKVVGFGPNSGTNGTAASLNCWSSFVA